MERPEQRPRTKSRTFSFRSDKSLSSKPSVKYPKGLLKETAEEKRRSHLTATTKANPNAAMNEAQPVATALEASTMGSLRSIQHTDKFGNPIAEPDLSNPTRPRWERPLDTIRSFEAAIDSEYKRRTILRADTSPGEYGNGYASRRSSYYGAYDQNSRYSHVGGYYGSRTASARESYVDHSYGHPPAGHPPAGHPPAGHPAAAGYPRMRHGPRMHSEPGHRYSNAYSNAHANGSGANVYPTQAYQQSRDTVNTGASSGSEPWTNNTDPSSENSSIERTPPAPRPEAGEPYGFTGFGGAPILEEYSKAPPPPPHGKVAGYFQPQHAGAPPAVPPKYEAPQKKHLRKPVGSGQPLTATSGNVPVARPALAENGEKRKSWFKRRFSKA